LLKFENLTNEFAATNITQRGGLMGDLRLWSLVLRQRAVWSVVDLEKYATSVYTPILQLEEECCFSDLVIP